MPVQAHSAKQSTAPMMPRHLAPGQPKQLCERPPGDDADRRGQHDHFTREPRGAPHGDGAPGAQRVAEMQEGAGEADAEQHDRRCTAPGERERLGAVRFGAHQHQEPALPHALKQF